MKEPRTKQRHANHITGDQGVDLVRNRLPNFWVVRDIHPDYGLDLHVEVFEQDKRNVESFNTLGEHFYVQVKTIKNVKTERITVRHRINVAKRDPDLKEGELVELEVVKFSLDTATLLTVETMGASVPVLLFLADLSTKVVYYICLNDYVTKALLPYNPSYENQGTVTVAIPTWNTVDTGSRSFGYLWFLARRGKLYAAFNTFAYHYHELQRAQYMHPLMPDERDPERVRIDPEFRTMARTFLKAALRLAIWQPSGSFYWGPLRDVMKDLQYCLRNFPQDEAVPDMEARHWEMSLLEAYRRADNLSRMYEEIVREWHLPTAMAAELEFSEGNPFSLLPVSPAIDR
ncbi:DUF4365 domain-containing protein [Corynebacterium testudinoris]|uniref:DUF4365 domain-containing protein n=1 Tax=Corynebacterium testudinoris TaxID=136857 RepID=UPI001C8BEEB6|nr:DUF4365 domain-containing protein [Corynebacterium testudinoris]MBX8995240.1 DUF4365 domain-containing protein [Corynebacterium testudinoris]